MDQQLPLASTDHINSLQIFNNLSKGARLGNAFGLDEKHLEAVYTLAFGQYQQGRYTHALKLFAFITFHDQTFMKAFKGIGSCLQMLGRYQEALLYLGLAIIDDDTDMQTAVQIAECLIHAGQPDDARALLKRIQHELAHNESNDYTRRKAEGLLELLSSGKHAKPANAETLN